jgi:hypothetical protein
MTKKVNIISSCHHCPFFGRSMDGMECNHPFWNDKGIYENMIMTQNNIRGKVPEKCPLKREPLTITYKLASL